MEEHRCPSREQNQAAHAKFLQDYGQLVAMVEENGASTKVALHLKQMLGDWLTNHICRIDNQLRHCAHKGAPVTRQSNAPERAASL